MGTDLHSHYMVYNSQSYSNKVTKIAHLAEHNLQNISFTFFSTDELLQVIILVWSFILKKKYTIGIYNGQV